MKFILVIISLLSFSMSINAQDAASVVKKSKKKIVKTKINKEWAGHQSALNLTNDQLLQLTEVEKEFNQKRRDLSKTGTNNKPDATALKALRKMRRDKINKVLGKDQRLALRKIKKQK